MELFNNMEKIAWRITQQAEIEGHREAVDKQVKIENVITAKVLQVFTYYLKSFIYNYFVCIPFDAFICSFSFAFDKVHSIFYL